MQLPNSTSTSQLLSHSVNTRKHYERIGVTHRLPFNPCIRATEKGLTGSVDSTKELQFYLPEDDLFVTDHIKSLGFTLKSSEHTSYIKGAFKNFGDLYDLMALFDSSGLDIVRAFCYSKGKARPRKYGSSGYMVIRKSY